MKSSMLPYWLSLMVLFVACYGGWKWYEVGRAEADRSLGGVLIDNRPPLEEFELTKSDGQPFRSADMRGKVWVASFFYTICPGPCRRLNANIKYLNSLEELKDVTWVSMTVDPQNDTPEVLADYAKQFDADPNRWIFCRADLSYVKRVGRDILQVDDVSWRGHRDYVVVVDRAGKVRGVFDATQHSQVERKMIPLLTECLAEKAPPLKADNPDAVAGHRGDSAKPDEDQPKTPVSVGSAPREDKPTARAGRPAEAA